MATYLLRRRRAREIPEKAADRLVAVAKIVAVRWRRRRAYPCSWPAAAPGAGQVVGVIAAEGCSEILPKIEGLGDATGNPSDSSIRRRLVQMLAVALDVEIDSGRVTKLGWQRDNLLEVLIGPFTHKLVDSVRTGLPRRYVGHEGDLSALRGRLDVTRQLQRVARTP